MLRRLTHTLEDLVRLRSEMIRKTERQVVQLAMAVATRIVSREIAVDRELLVAMARVALDRLGDSASARVRLHPEDYAAVQRLGSASVRDGAVQVVSDPSIHRGGCVVESDFGLIDVSVDAQVEELTRALLSDDDSFDPVPVHALAGNAAHVLEQ
jgi:flagellar assembly protein FliH